MGLPTSQHRKELTLISPYELPRGRQAFAEGCLPLEQINFKEHELGQEMITLLKRVKMALGEARRSLRNLKPKA